MSTIKVGPEDAESLKDLKWVEVDGVRFTQGELVWVTHIPSGQRVFGELAEFFGVGRVRGAHVIAPFIGTTAFYFGKPEDSETYSIRHVNGETA